MDRYTVSTFGRFMYLNMYAFLLLFVGIGILFIPMDGISEYMIYIQVVVFLFILNSSIRIFRSWKVKKRRYFKLVERNSESFDPKSFEVFMQAPCGRLLVRIVLKDLGMAGKYRMLKQYQRPLWKVIMDNMSNRKVVTYIREEKNE